MSDNLKSSVVSGMKWLLISKFIIQLLRWGSTFWVIRLLNSEDYGIMAIVGIMTAILMSGNFLSIGNVIIRFKIISKPVLDTLLTLTILIGIFFSFLQFMAAPWLAKFYETKQAELVLQLMAFTYILEAFSVRPMALLAKQMKFKILAKIDLIMGIITPISVLIAAYIGMGYWAIAIGLVVNSVVKSVASNLLMPTCFTFGKHFKRTSRLLYFGLQNSISSIIAEINSQLDFIIGGYYFTTSQLGVYSVGLQISFIPLRKLSPELRRIAFPAFSKISNDKKRVLSYYLKSIRLISLFVFPLFFGLGMVAEPLIEVVLTNKWFESAIIIQIICFALPFRLLTETSVGMLNALGLSNIVLKNNIITIAVFVLAVFPLIDTGITGLAWAWVISIIAAYTKILYEITKILPTNVFSIIRALTPSLLASIFMILVIMITNMSLEVDNTTLLFIDILAGGLGYFLVVFFGNKLLLLELRNMFKK
ncbi:MAG: lipopolysaccharide biosynthesis protein [Pseudomonadales bacterium]|nr:lipopolysaccharide biosynthesis protein [Pseudomonadales bacterium]